MNFKKILRKLISQFPEDDYRQWVFEADEVGYGYHPYYGISKLGGWHKVTGVRVDCRIVDSWYTTPGKTVDDREAILPEKFGNIMAAYVAMACPDNVQKLLDEIDTLRQQLLQSRQCLSNLGHGDLTGDAKQIALNEVENINEILEVYENS